MTVRARSGRPVEAITLAAVTAGEVGIDDIRIHPDTLRAQADVAAAHGNPQLAANLLRAAELALLPDDRVLAIYEALRPRRSTHAELLALADELTGDGCPRNADLIREAAAAYQRRGLTR